MGNVSQEMMRLTEREAASATHHAALRFQVLPLSLLILALVAITGMAFFRSDYWLLGATFIAGGFLIVSTLLYVASKRLTHPRSLSGRTSVKHFGTGALSTTAGMASLLAVTGEIGAGLGSYAVFVEQLGFALVVMGAFWLTLVARDRL